MRYLLIDLSDDIPQEGPHLLNGLYAYVEFDAVPESTNRRAAEVTQHPVEEGADISDNVRPLPRELDLIGVVSDVPASLLDWVNRSTTYAWDMYERLHDWMDAGTVLTVLAAGEHYGSMAIVSMDRGHNHTRGKSIHLSLSLREIEVVSTELVEAPKPATTRGSARKSKGQKATKDSKTESANESILLGLGGLLGG